MATVEIRICIVVIRTTFRIRKHQSVRQHQPVMERKYIGQSFRQRKRISQY
jgi:hypothetical protein